MKVFRWLHANLFSSPLNTLLTLAVGYALAGVLVPLGRWAIVDAHGLWASPQACKAAGGACWAVIGEKYRFMLFGPYPYAEQWRPLLATLLFIGLIGISINKRCWRRWLGWVWVGGLAIIAGLMWGGFWGLAFVENERWGGLPLTLALSAVAIVASFPLAILLALGRRSDMPAIRALCVGYIELVRGVPLISVLFMASVMLPLFLPEGMTIDKLLRAQIGIILFTAAYLAEVVRAGLQAIPRGQSEAADALGLSYVQKMRLVILPQALRLVIPPMVNTFIATFKDTSLVIIIGLFDLLGTVRAALADPVWRGFYVESYLFAAALYFCFCFFMSKYSQALEADLRGGQGR